MDSAPDGSRDFVRVAHEPVDFQGHGSGAYPVDLVVLEQPATAEESDKVGDGGRPPGLPDGEGHHRTAAVSFELHQVQEMCGIGPGYPATYTADGCRESNIVQDVQVGEQQRALGNHGHATVFGTDLGHVGAAKNDPSGITVLRARSSEISWGV